MALSLSAQDAYNAKYGSDPILGNGAGSLTSTPVSASSASLVPAPTQTPSATVPTSVPTTTPPTTTNTGGGTTNTTSTGRDPHINPATGVWDDAYYANWANSQKSDADRAREAQQAQIRSGISNAYQPIYGELDRQLAGLPGQQLALEGQVGSLADQQKGQVNFGAQQQQTALDQNKTDEQTRSKQTLRDLSDNIRNLLQGASFYLGSLGAGDSSATQGASTAIINSADKTRGQVLNTTNQALTGIDRQKANVQAVADNNLKQIDDWKNNKMFDVAQWATDTLNNLKQARASASQQEQMAINQLIQNTESQFLSRVQQIDDNVQNFKNSITSWQMQTNNTLQGGLTDISNAGAYTSQTGQAYSSLLNPSAQSFTPVSSGSQNGTTAPGSGGLLSGLSGFLGNLFGGNQNKQQTQANTLTPVGQTGQTQLQL